jgi:uncharacterized protein (TIGR02611 family)
MSETRPRTPKLIQRLQERRRTHHQQHPVVRAAFVVVGVLLVAGGVAMLVLPGPAFVVIPIGLAVLSLEFAWAGRLLDHALLKAEAAQEKAARASRLQKALTAAAVVLGAAAFATAAMLYDIPLLPV